MYKGPIDVIVVVNGDADGEPLSADSSHCELNYFLMKFIHNYRPNGAAD